MPATKNAMTRYKILDELLSDRYHSYSLDELTEEVSNRLAKIDDTAGGVVRRTIEKDIRYLEYESPFLVDIERYSVSSYDALAQKPYTKRCLRYASPSFSIFKKEMTSDEKHLLREALSILGQFDGLPALEGLEALRKTLDVNDDERHIISFTKNPLENSHLLAMLFTTIAQQQVVELRFHTFKTPEKSLSAVVHPYLLKEYNCRWFLVAASDNDGQLLTFSLDRIDKVKPLPAWKYREYGGDLRERFEDIIGVTLYEGRAVERILFWVSDESKDYVTTKPLHESQTHYRNEQEKVFRSRFPQLCGGAFFSINCIPNYELVRELSSFGPELIVLSPTSIQDDVFTRFSKSYTDYLKLRTTRSQ